MSLSHATIQRRRTVSIRRKKRSNPDEIFSKDTVSTKQIQRAIENPTEQNLTPEIIMQIRATHGNKFLNNLVQQSQPIQRWQSATPTKQSTPQFDQITSDSIGMFEKIKGLKKAKKAIKKPQKLVDQIRAGNQEKTREETLTEHPSIVSEQATNVASAMQAGNFMSAVGGLQAINAILGQYIGLGKSIQKFVMSIIKTVDAYKTRKALAKTIKLLKSKIDDGTASQSETDVFDSTSYGLSKVTRRFIESIAKTVILLGKAISTWVSFFSGGTTAVFTGVVDLLTTSAQSALKGYRAGKAIYKERKQTKGVHRAESAQALLTAAFNNQPHALQLMMKLKVGKIVWNNKVKKGEVSGKFPKTTIEMAMFLRKVNDKEANIMRDELKNKLSSSVYRSGDEKGKIKKYKRKAKKGLLI